MSVHQKVFCLMGPTASGKTDLAIALHESFPIEIISVDSVQIYQGMDIGTGKPNTAILDKIPHHLINILSPKESYSVAQFREDTLRLIAEIFARNRIPLLVGGTMLYFKGLQQGLSPLPPSDQGIRQKLTTQLHEEGLPALYQFLLEVDPLTANRLSPGDQQRIQRALEVYMMTGKPFSFWLNEPSLTPASYQFINMGLIPLVTPRSELHQRIEQRFHHMLEQGFISEVASLFGNPELNSSLPSIRAVGYKQLWQYLSHEINMETMCEKAIAATRQLAKRQLTWLRHWDHLNVFDFQDHQLLKKVEDFIHERLQDKETV